MLWTSLVAALAALAYGPSPGAALSVTVFGGGGFTGSRVCKLLVRQGASVTSVSKSGTAPDWCRDEAWSREVRWQQGDLLSADDASLDAAVGRPDAVVSCVGVVGTDPATLLQGNGAANVAAFNSAQRGGKLRRAAYVSVASEVAACKDNWLPDFFTSYFEGKIVAEQAAIAAVGDAARVCVVKPTFIYGGASFGLLPPRVNDAYGAGVEELLMLPPFRLLADATPGLIRVALRPPVGVEAVAGACARAVLDDSGADLPVLDGTDAINDYAEQPPSTGLTDALAWSKEQAIRCYEWAKVEVPKAIDAVQSKMDESKSK